MAEPSELVSYVGAGAGGIALAWKAVEVLLIGRLKKGEKVEEQVEKDTAAKLDTMLSVLQRLEREVALLTQSAHTQNATVNEVKGRIDGMSANYGARLAELEKAVVELRTLQRRARK